MRFRLLQNFRTEEGGMLDRRSRGMDRDGVLPVHSPTPARAFKNKKGNQRRNRLALAMGATIAVCLTAIFLAAMSAITGKPLFEVRDFVASAARPPLEVVIAEDTSHWMGQDAADVLMNDAKICNQYRGCMDEVRSSDECSLSFSADRSRIKTADALLFYVQATRKASRDAEPTLKVPGKREDYPASQKWVTMTVEPIKHEELDRVLFVRFSGHFLFFVVPPFFHQSPTGSSSSRPHGHRDFMAPQRRHPLVLLPRRQAGEIFPEVGDGRERVGPKIGACRGVHELELSE